MNEKLYLITRTNYSEFGTETTHNLTTTYEKAREIFVREREDFIKLFKYNKIQADDENYFAIYNDGYYAEWHIELTIKELKIED